MQLGTGQGGQLGAVGTRGSKVPVEGLLGSPHPVPEWGWAPWSHMKGGEDTEREDPCSQAECGVGLTSGMGLALVALRLTQWPPRRAA